jgi:hypothetical protein
VASKPLQTEAERLREACDFVSSSEFTQQPQYRAALKVHAFLLDHVTKCAFASTTLPSAARPPSGPCL